MQHHHDHQYSEVQLNLKKRKSGWVLVITIITMILEIIYGYMTNSMALSSSGWHMAVHVITIGSGWLTYQYVLTQQANKRKVNTSKILSAVGFINAVIIATIAIMVLFESIERWQNPIPIQFDNAIWIAVFGLLVNILSVKILHHEDEYSDFNLKATYLHILSDILTSVLALVALLVGYYFKMIFADAVVGIIAGVVILIWAKNLIVRSGKEIFLKTEL